MRRYILCLILAALALPLLPAPASAQLDARQVVCPPGPIPQGWVKVDEISSAFCAGNAWVTEPFTNKAPGSAMTICADQPTPPGWYELHLVTSSSQCSEDSSGSLKAILRLG